MIDSSSEEEGVVYHIASAMEPHEYAIVVLRLVYCGVVDDRLTGRSAPFDPWHPLYDCHPIPN